MGAIKEFFFDEIISLQEGEEINFDDKYFEEKWRNHTDAAAEKDLELLEQEIADVEVSGIPKFLNSKF